MNKNKYEQLKNKIDEEIKSIEESKSKLNKLIEEVKKAEQEEKCSNKMPFEIGDECYYISISGYIVSDKWDNDVIDMWRFSQGHVFKTKEETEDKLFQLKLEAKAREFRRINNCDVTEKDLRNSNEFNYCIYYNLISGIAIENHSIVIEPNKLGYFNSKEMAKKFIKENKEDLIKYFKIEMGD